MTHEITLDTPIKFLRSDGSGTHSDHAHYPLGETLTADGLLVLCLNGYHHTTPRHWHEWASDRCYLLDVSEEHLTGGSKSCRRWIRLTAELTTWNPRSQRLLACQIAESVLPFFEVRFPNDPRSRQAIETARRFARGECGADELRAADPAARAAVGAARAAVGAAAYAAADAAADAAAYAAADAAYVAADAARAAARAAADAAYAAVGVARAAAYAAQNQAQLQYAEWFLQTIRGEINQ